MKELAQLSKEIRSLIIEVVSKNGGHLSPNLGVVEMTMALHYVFDAPEDKIIWDVGHQCYTHKILTGRKDAFANLRQLDGLCGFPCREESEWINESASSRCWRTPLTSLTKTSFSAFRAWATAVAAVSALTLSFRPSSAIHIEGITGTTPSRHKPSIVSRSTRVTLPT